VELKREKFPLKIKILKPFSGDAMKKSKKIGLMCSRRGHFTEPLQGQEALKGYPTFLITYKEVFTS